VTDRRPPRIDADRAGRVDLFLRELTDAGRIPGWAWALITADGVCHAACGGVRDLEHDRPVEDETLFRIYSMTKPVTAVAALVLFERGLIELTDPLHAYLPEFASTEVYVSSQGDDVRTRPPSHRITIGQALSHTSGLTYGFHHSHPVDALYRARGYDIEAPAGTSLSDSCATWATLPLLFDPGSAWNYSVGTDVVGRVIEVVSGLSLGEFFLQEIFDPLDMVDTTFHVPARHRHRLARIYQQGPTGQLTENADLGRLVTVPGSGHYGGGGLVSTLGDYSKFAGMLLRDGCASDGTAVLAPQTLRFMMRNHLPHGQDIATFGRTMTSELGFIRVGQALGGTVLLDESAAPYLCSSGEYGWGGIASTYFWVSPAIGAAAVFMLQFTPSGALPIRGRLHQLVHQAIAA